MKITAAKCKAVSTFACALALMPSVGPWALKRWNKAKRARAGARAAASACVIGAADGPTSIFVSSGDSFWRRFSAVCAAVSIAAMIVAVLLKSKKREKGAAPDSRREDGP